MTCSEKLIKFHGYVQDTIKKSKGKHELFVEITRFENLYHICYHPSCPKATFREVIFSLREKIEKNKINGRMINSKGDTKFSRYCPKNLHLFPKAYFVLSKSL